MKSHLVVYLGIFLLLVSGVYFCYNRYYPRLIEPDFAGKAEKADPSISKGITFIMDEALYSANANTNINRFAEDSLVKIRSDIKTADLDIMKNLLIHSDGSKDNSKIELIDGLEDQSGEITGYSILKDQSKIYFIATEKDKYKIMELVVDTKKTASVIESDKKMSKIVVSDAGAYFLQSQETNRSDISNLYFLNFNTKSVKPIIEIAFPSTITNYNLSNNAEKIVFEVGNTNEKTNNINICDLNGKNIMQITSDGRSKYPVFSPDDEAIAFWKENEGIFTFNLITQETSKIINLKNKIETIYFWR